MVTKQRYFKVHNYLFYGVKNLIFNSFFYYCNSACPKLF